MTMISVSVKQVLDQKGHATFSVAPTSSVFDALALMAEHDIGAVLVMENDALRGIFTERDYARKLVLKGIASRTALVGDMMTTNVQTITPAEQLSAVMSTMTKKRFRHLPVVDRDGRLVGLIRLHEALAAAAPALLRQIERLARDDTLDGIKDVKAAQVELAEELLAEELTATEIQQVLTRINNDLYRRVGEAALRAMAEEGWGDPPAAAATIVMGSGGRGENYLLPDQDNGFIIADYPDSAHGRIDAFFLELAERLCRDLNEIGIPYCNGYCMAVNPLWRKTLPQWIAQIGIWTRRGSTVAIRLADIFFDFQPVWGETALARENIELPAGRLESAERDFTLRVQRSYQRPEDFAQIALARGEDGYVVRIGDVARVELASAERRAYFRSNGAPNVGLGIVKTSTANSLDVARAARDEAVEIQQSLPEGTQIFVAFDSTVFIDAAVKRVYWTLFEALALVLVVIYLFLGSLRAAIIPAVTVPVCLVAAFVALAAFGFSINLLTLLALVLCIGLVVDDAIVVLENVQRRADLGEPPLVASRRGTAQVAFAVIATTAVLVAVFLPVGFMEGNTGRLFRELSVALAAAVAISAFVALTLTPMMSSK